MLQAPELEIDKQLGKPNAHGKLERRIIANLLDHVLKGDFRILGIDDGEEFTKAQDIKDTMELIFNLDEAAIIVHKKGHSKHYIKIVLGNEIDVISDWSFSEGDKDGFDQLMEKFDAEEYA